MASGTRKGWHFDRANSRLDIYYGGSRIGDIDAGGMNLVTGLTYQINGTSTTVLSGADLVVADNAILQIGTSGDGAIVNSSAGLAANTALTSVMIGTPVTFTAAANSTLITNITASGDILMAVNKGGHSQAVLFADASAGTLYVNAAASGSVYITVATVTEYTFSATAFLVATGNNIQFNGSGNGILDSSGNESIMIEAVESAVNYLNVLNAATANNIVLECKGTADKGFTFINQEDEEILILNSAASSVENIQITSAAAGAGATIAAVTSATNANLRFDTAGAGYIIFSLGGVETFQMHDAAAMVFAGATDTAGHAAYLQTEDGGTDGGTASSGMAGALLHVSTGDGSAAVTTDAIGGAGGALSIVSGAGAAGNGAGNGGVGGAVAITAGAAGNSGAGAGTGGTGGSITLTAGAGGGAGGGTAGAPGKVAIGAGTFRMKVQTMDMADAAKTLTLIPGAPTGVTLTGNILYVDANSGTTENLLLPPETDCTGLVLFIMNTGGETINLQNDAGGALLTIATAEHAIVTCDGTTWWGVVGVV